MAKDRNKNTQTENAEQANSAEAPAASAKTPPNERPKVDPHVLEETYPDPLTLLSAYPVPAITHQSVIVALDTSVLLLPYEMRNSASLDQLAKTYGELARQNRLFVPGRALREFVNRRETSLGNLINALNQRKANLPATDMPVVLAGMTGYEDAIKAIKAIEQSRMVYFKAIDKLVSAMKSWRGNDPVTSLYLNIFKSGMVVDLPQDPNSKKEQANEHDRRLRNRVPPGYKDKPKPDGGIGDFLIWKAILELGQREKKHMAFVTGDEKSDWFSQATGEHIYPRYPLVNEYRRHSGGCSLRLMSLHELLREMDAPKAVVDDVRSAEVAGERQADVQLFTYHTPEGSFAIANTSPHAVSSSVMVPPHSLTVVSSTASGWPTGPTGPGWSGATGPTGWSGPTGPAGPGGSATTTIWPSAGTAPAGPTSRDPARSTGEDEPTEG